MVGVKKTITTAIVALVVASVVHADMVPMSPSEDGARWAQTVCVRTTLGQPNGSQGLETFCGTVGCDLLPVGFLPEVNEQVGEMAPAKLPEILTDRQNSLSLCLYALLGLGLCRSAPLVKKFHIGCIPDWYHSGGPSQIGHSLAIPPDCLSPVLVYGFFIQPEHGTHNLLSPGYGQKMMVSLWRRSQFTAAVLASRGPPNMS